MPSSSNRLTSNYPLRHVAKLDKNVKTYLSASGVAAIYILVDGGKPVAFGVAKNLDAVTRKLATQKYGWVAWGRNYGELVEICRFKNIEVLLGKDLRDCVEGLVQIAESRKVVLTPHEVVMQRAENLARKIKMMFLELKRKGDLREFNRAYAKYRFSESTKGKTVLPYFGVMERFRRIVIKALIEGTTDRIAMLGILHKEFPWLSTYATPTDNRQNY